VTECIQLKVHIGGHGMPDIFNISLSGAPPSDLEHQPPTQNLIEKAGLGELFACDIPY
jgi:hypothetical protein